ncbi:MAG: glutamine-hydrolyzing GMP synthase [Candidatus Korarchaeota archaeon]|nr:glutamine-hydrolyzing GMP synthase [Candidatus Korarchaeota archaeon]
MTVLVVNFGGQYAHLITRRIRDIGVYAEIVPYTKASKEFVEGMRPSALILSGGPSSVYEPGAPSIGEWVLDLDIPVLGICYGFQLLAKMMGGEVERSKGEYGPTRIRVLERRGLFEGWDDEELVWMSHSDHVTSPPTDTVVTAISENEYVAAFRHLTKPIFGVQFHPEVRHTPKGRLLLENFSIKLARSERSWSPERMLSIIEDYLRKELRDCKSILSAVSGGIDSTVATVLVSRFARDRVTAVFVNHGLLRKGEPEEVLDLLRGLGIDPVYVDASQEFLEALKGVEGCEDKRRVIGELFIKVFSRALKGREFDCLVQGTLYPDVIESGGEVGADRIKSHHNVAGLPGWLNAKVVEPLKYLYKDEVRKLARHLGLPERLVERHPFPGPGLAVRIIGEVTEEKLRIAREASAIVEDVLRERGYYSEAWQAFAVVGDDKWVGVKGDARVDGYIVTVRVVESEDAMTADWLRLPPDVLEEISKRITSELPKVTMVTYAVTTKPPSTIEPC